MYRGNNFVGTSLLRPSIRREEVGFEQLLAALLRRVDERLEFADDVECLIGLGDRFGRKTLTGKNLGIPFFVTDTAPNRANHVKH
jgi:hypothetical protein